MCKTRMMICTKFRSVYVARSCDRSCDVIRVVGLGPLLHVPPSFRSNALIAPFSMSWVLHPLAVVYDRDMFSWSMVTGSSVCC